MFSLAHAGKSFGKTSQEINTISLTEFIKFSSVWNGTKICLIIIFNENTFASFQTPRIISSSNIFFQIFILATFKHFLVVLYRIV